MIFLTVGTHPQQFDRLLEKVDELMGKGKINGPVFGQIGNSEYEPKNFEFARFLGLNEFNGAMEKADLVITHAGEGNIGIGLQLRKKMVIVPRLKKFREHTNDHQLELAGKIGESGMGIIVNDISGLEKAIDDAKALNVWKVRKQGKIIEVLEKYVSDEFGG